MSAQTIEKTNAAGYEGQLNDWIQQEKAAIDLISAIGKLWFEKSIELVIFRHQLVDRSNSEIMNLHLYAKNIVKIRKMQFKFLNIFHFLCKIRLMTD